MNLKYTIQAGLVMMIMLMVTYSCKQTPVAPRARIYTDLYQPASVNVRFPAGTQLPSVQMSIDHLKGLIYNKEYLPYGSTLDSAYLQMMLSSECDAVITNETTGERKQWSVSDTSKVNVKGGKLTLTVSRRGSKTPALNYKIRLQIYGYNPNKLTWKLSANEAPIPTTSAAFVQVDKSTYWMARNVDEVSIYQVVDLGNSAFKLLATGLPKLRPETIMSDHNGGLWAISDDDHLYRADKSLQNWSPINTDKIRISTLVYDQALTPGTPAEWRAIGYSPESPKDYSSYTIIGDQVEGGSSLSEDFPVRYGYVFDYTVAGINNANIIGGVDKLGKGVKEVFFTSDGLNWGKIPYRGKGFETPLEGGLFLRKGDTIYMIGGRYEDGVKSQMYVSQNRGVNWVELTKEQEPGKDFAPREGASGLILDQNGNESIYIVGGKVNGKASTEIWRGYLDKTGGIINSIED